MTRRRPGSTVLLAVLLPLLTLLAAALTVPAPPPGPTVDAPERARPSDLALACPSALPGTGTIRIVAPGKDASGRVRVTAGGTTRQVRVPRRGVAEVQADGPAVLVARGDLAATLRAGRAGGSFAAAGCTAPMAEQWFTGVGAGPVHRSVLELVNPDRGPATAEITVYGENGVVEVPRLRGIRVEGGEHVSLDLATLAPSTDQLTLRVVVTRGRLASAVRDTVRPIGRGTATREWVGSQPEPSRGMVLLGLPEARGSRTLVLTNPGSDQARVELRVLTAETSFSPRGTAEVAVSPESTTTVDLTSVLRRAERDGATGLLLTSDEPVTATLRAMAADDLVHLAPVAATDTSAALVPAARTRLVIGVEPGAEQRLSTATVVSRDARGEVLDRRRLELRAGTARSGALPADTALVTVHSPGAPVVAVLRSGREGRAVRRLTPTRGERLVPQVEPQLP